MENPESAAEQVSGQSAFWILVTLAVAAVTQPSASSRRKERNLFGGRIDVLRCIPGVCLFDGVIDIVVLGRAIHHELFAPGLDDQRRRRVPPTSPSIATVKLAIFTLLYIMRACGLGLSFTPMERILTFAVLAVVPQSIKVFSMRGIPATQLIASVFLFAATTGLAIELSGLDTDNHYCPAGEDSDTPASEILKLISALLILILQSVLEMRIWSNIGLSRAIPLTLDYLPSDVRDLCDWLILASVFPLIAQLLIWPTHFVLARRRRGSGRSSAPRITPIFGSWLCIVVVLARKPQEVGSDAKVKAPPSWARHQSYYLVLMLIAALVSVLAAKILHYLGVLIARRRTDGQAIGSPSDNANADAACGPAVTSHEAGTDQRSARPTSARTSDEASNGLGSNRLVALFKGSVHWVGMLPLRIDNGLIDLLTLRSNVSSAIALTIFNLITTVYYYLVSFDGTGTTSPSWTSVLG